MEMKHQKFLCKNMTHYIIYICHFEFSMYMYISYKIWFESLKSEALKLWWTLLYLVSTTKLWRRFLLISVTSSWTSKILVLYDKERIWTLFPMSSGNHLFWPKYIFFSIGGSWCPCFFPRKPDFILMNNAMKENDDQIWMF